MFDNIKLEKGLYNLSGKTFLDTLEEQDPSENYIGTPMENLDAFERQLKRFDIKISGKNCDCVEKFFSTTETAVLFPEYIKRCIQQGIEDNNIGEIIAIKTLINGTAYRGTYITDSTTYDNAISQGGTFAESSIYENATSEILNKMGRIINATYEAIRHQNLELFSVQLRIIGRKIGNALYKKLIACIDSNAGVIDTATTSLDYTDLVNLFSKFTTYDMNILIASPSTCNTILTLPEFTDGCCCPSIGNIVLPFGSKLIKSTAVADGKIYALDKNFAIEFVTSTDLFMETDCVINRQLDRLAVSIPYIFRCITSDAVKILNIKS